MAILAKLLVKNLKFVLPSIYSNCDIQTNFEVNQTQIIHYIPINTPKTHQNGHISKPHSPKSLLLLHFSMNLSETFRIVVNMDFAHTNRGRFLIYASKKNLSPKSKNSRAIFHSILKFFFSKMLSQIEW